MRKIREVLRLRWECHSSQSEIAGACSIGQATVSEYLRRATAAGLSWPLPADQTDEDLDRLLFPAMPSAPAGTRPAPNWSDIREKMGRRSMTLQLAWEQYHAAEPDAYGYSWFCENYRLWMAKTFPRMRLDHIPGDKLYVDYAGETVPVVDRSTGEVLKAQIFVATLGATNYTYAEATWTQAGPDWIGSNTRALEFFGGVPRAIVPDNLKVGITSANFYEPDINKTYAEWGKHYGVAILPARVRRPRDKSKVENGVLQVERRILAAMYGREFFSLVDLNSALREFLIQLNERETKDLPASRKVMFEETERQTLSPLPVQRYEPQEWFAAKVHIDYHINVDRHFYSVHHSLIGVRVDVRLTAYMVEIFHNNARVASHVRSTLRNRFTTLPEHRPQNHAAVFGMTDQSLLRKAAVVGPNTGALIQRIIGSFEYPEEGYRRCQGILRLGEERGHEALEQVSAVALETGITSYRRIKNLIDNKTKKEMHTETIPVHHDNIRGAGYYQDNPAV